MKVVTVLSACVKILNQILIFCGVRKNSKKSTLDALRRVGSVNTSVYRLVLENTKKIWISVHANRVVLMVVHVLFMNAKK